MRFDREVKNKLRSKANLAILEGFLSESLKEDIQITDIRESEGNRETASDKLTVWIRWLGFERAVDHRGNPEYPRARHSSYK